LQLKINLTTYSDIIGIFMVMDSFRISRDRKSSIMLQVPVGTDTDFGGNFLSRIWD